MLPMDDLMTGPEFLSLRERLGFNQKQMAEAMGLSPRTILEYEKSATLTKTATMAALGLEHEKFGSAPRIERMVRKQLPHLGEHLYVSGTFWGPDFIDALEAPLTAEVQRWMEHNTPSGKPSTEIVLREDLKRIAVPVIAFGTAREAEVFAARWG